MLIKIAWRIFMKSSADKGLQRRQNLFKSFAI